MRLYQGDDRPKKKKEEEEEEEQNSLIDIKAEGDQQSKLSNLCNILQLVFSTVVGNRDTITDTVSTYEWPSPTVGNKWSKSLSNSYRSEPSSTSLFTDSLGSNEIISQGFCRLIWYLIADILLI